MTGLDVTTLIQSLGFPIVAFLLMFWQNNTTIKNNTDAINKLCDMLERK